ncbi:amino acid adenylation domain-containing protein [Undibacterium sp. Di27W]|uniref:amino acid adenylation domain-containing protein n=1 Tax=Undibacterium sp. Di27W TaxID=3413036 RepID=UPI003BF41028
MTYISNLALAFNEIVCRFADRRALYYPSTDEAISYRCLSDKVEQLARALHARGLRQGQVVALFNDKSADAFACMLACLRLGLIYTNLDPASPWERLRKILHTCQPALLVNSFPDLSFNDGQFEEAKVRCLRLDELLIAVESIELPDCRAVSGSSPAYIMFTSGSTGTPKGAVMSHANLLWFIQWARDRFSVTEHDVLTNVNPSYFDNSVFDFYTALFSGATLLPFTVKQVHDTRALVRLLNQAACTIWFSVPSMLVYLLTTRALSKTDLPNIRKIIFGGEGFPKSKLKQLFDLFAERADLENVYGPTECTCICSAYHVQATDFDDMSNLAPLGKLAQNFDYEILALDEQNPDKGELFLRGPQVGLAYYNDAQRSALAFVQNPLHTRYSDVGYRTGDIVMRDAEGNLHFQGRADFQIKHMGYRIELEEIEAAINTLGEVTECAVIYKKFDNGLGQIIAYAATNVVSEPANLLARIAAIVPTYMVPRHLFFLDALPKNANGKIDRVKLAEIDLKN